MALYRFQVAAAYESLLPRDRIVNDLYFTRVLDSGDDDGLCTDLAHIFDDNWYAGSPEITVSMYDQGASPSGPPRARQTINAGTVGQSNGPREVALCLSFWATNRQDPTKRGRIFLCVPPHIGMSAVGVRPSASIMDEALDLGDAIVGLGGADVSWQVYSRKNNSSEDVTNTWCDDEWDTIRSRGLRAETRATRGV